MEDGAAEDIADLVTQEKVTSGRQPEGRMRNGRRAKEARKKARYRSEVRTGEIVVPKTPALDFCPCKGLLVDLLRPQEVIPIEVQGVVTFPREMAAWSEWGRVCRQWGE